MSLTSKTILIVDDELSFCQLMQRILEENEFSSDYVTSGAAALELLKTKRFDMVMTDIQMPEMDGLELIERIRTIYPKMAILVTTGMHQRDIAMQAINLGAYGYMLKPCDDLEIVVQVTNVLRRAELEELARAYQNTLETEVAARTLELEESNQKLAETIQILQQQEKLASIGQLAAGVAHEMKTPTGYIATNLNSLEKYIERLLKFLQALQRTVKVSASTEQQTELKALAGKLKIDLIIDDIGDLVDNCQEGAGRVKEIIKGLKDFSRTDGNVEEGLDLNQILEDSLLLVHNELKYKAEVSVENSSLPTISGYRQRLSQVFINLLINAAHAINENGHIKVTTTKESDQLVIRIADDGCGIPPENLDKIFTAFYTTKAAGVGTGLGLSIVKDIVEEHQGRIEVASTPGSGTEFTVRLPVGTTAA